jgi:flavodoxin
MKALVIYDSTYGNTEKIARAIGAGLSAASDATVLHVKDATSSHLEGIDLLILGSPTQRFNPTPAIVSFIKNIPEQGLKSVRIAAFDTRFTKEEMKSISSVLSFTAGIVGDSAYGAKYIASGLKKKGGELAVPPEGFYVRDTEGPLLDGELDRAENWARRILTH